MAAVTVHSDFGAQENQICHCFHFSPIYLPQSDGTRCHDLSFSNAVLNQLSHSPLLSSSRGSLATFRAGGPLGAQAVCCGEWHFCSPPAGSLGWIWAPVLRRRWKELLNGNLCGIPGANSHVLEPRQTFFIRRHLSVFGSSKGHMNFQVPGASLLGKLARLLECKTHQREEGHCQG